MLKHQANKCYYFFEQDREFNLGKNLLQLDSPTVWRYDNGVISTCRVCLCWISVSQSWKVILLYVTVWKLFSKLRHHIENTWPMNYRSMAQFFYVYVLVNVAYALVELFLRYVIQQWSWLYFFIYLWLNQWLVETLLNKFSSCLLAVANTESLHLSNSHDDVIGNCQISFKLINFLKATSSPNLVNLTSAISVINWLCLLSSNNANKVNRISVSSKSRDLRTMASVIRTKWVSG